MQTADSCSHRLEGCVCQICHGIFHDWQEKYSQVVRHGGGPGNDASVMAGSPFIGWETVVTYFECSRCHAGKSEEGPMQNYTEQHY
jgi:hypothetical protein